MTSARQPLVSVIVPIYGVEKYLRSCVESILTQSLRELEVILVNDGSPDDCPQIADEYAAADSRVRVIHKENRGYGHSCNVGLEAATGEYIAIAEPDDYLEADMYRDLYTLARERGADIVKSDFYNFYDIGEFQQHSLAGCPCRITERNFTIGESPELLLFHPSVWTCLYRTAFLRQHGIRFVEPRGAGWADNPFQVQTLCLAETISYTPKAYYHYRRLNTSDADELKDWRIPFERSEDIHSWLSQQGITQPEVLACLYARELYYIGMVLRSLPRRRHKEAKPAIDRMLARMDESVLQNSPSISSRRRKEYQKLKEGRYLSYLYSFKQLKRLCFNVKLGRGGFLFQLFGLQIATPRYQDTPALWRIRLK